MKIHVQMHMTVVPCECTSCYLQSESSSILYRILLRSPEASILQQIFHLMQEGRGDWTHGWQTLNSKLGKHKVGSDFPKKTWKKNQMARAHSSRYLDLLERNIERTIGAIELSWPFNSVRGIQLFRFMDFTNHRSGTKIASWHVQKHFVQNSG